MKNPGIYLAVVLSLITNLMYAQDEIWYFGNEAGINFNGSTPVALTNSAMSAIDYSAAVSDDSGNILFYTNSLEVWDKTHTVMQNGTGLMGEISNGQTALIVQQPGSEFYYIFTVGEYNSNAGLRYHIVDITQNGGLGAITSKNNLLLSPSTERLDAVYDPGTGSFWVITHAWNTNEFYAYNISSSGLNVIPVVSSTGTIHTGGTLGNYNSMGQLCISPLRNQLICAICTEGIFELFDFDISTGVVSNPVTLTGFSNAWGAAFSPDATKLYVTEWYNSEVIQMDITSGQDSSILSTAMVVGYGTGPGGAYQVGYLQLAPDNKIYGAVFDDDHLLVINNPNLSGLASDVIDDGFYLDGKTSQAGLCRSVKPILTTSASDFSLNENISIYPNPASQQICISFTDYHNQKEEFKYQIFNLLGTEIQHGSIKNIDQQKISLNGISKGIYSVKVTDSGNKMAYWHKLIIQ